MKNIYKMICYTRGYANFAYLYRRHLKFFFFCALLLVANFSYSHEKFLIQNLYFPKPGKEEAVYQLRLKASQVITQLGLHKGRVLKREKLSDRPYVMWECDFNSKEDRKKFTETLKKSPAFLKIERRMGLLVDRFERVTWIRQ